jgi:GntR family transcriptional regulator
MDQVQAMIGSGRLTSGDLLPSVRQLGADLEVNMMTVSKAYARLEADGILERVRGKGMRVRQRESSGRVKDRQQQLKPLVDPMVTRAQQLGLTDEQIIAVVKSVLRERRS